MNRAGIGKSKAVDRAIKCLAPNQRRIHLRYMLEPPETWFEREELARYLHEGSSDLSALEIGLAHHHLPKLDEFGLIEYDHRSGVVRPTDAVEQLEAILEDCEELEEVWG